MAKITRLFSQSTQIPGHPKPEEAYFDHPLQVPPGVDQLRATLEYHRDAPEWDLILSAFDPQGFRGSLNLVGSSEGPVGDVQLSMVIGGPNHSRACIPGPITPGVWIFQIWAGHVNCQLSCHLTVEAYIDEGKTAAQTHGSFPTPRLDRVVRNKPGWYVGELHTHTLVSDGYFSTETLVDKCREAGLDYLAVTDHNTIGAWPDLAQVEDICIIPSLELTTPGGHCNIWGLGRWLDWRVDYQGRMIEQVANAARLQNALVSVNHPFAPGYSWQFDADLGLLDCVEILGYPSWWPASTQFNPMALGLWTSMLNAGHRITAVGGSDVFHLSPGGKYPGSPYAEGIARPATVVYAECLSASEILNGLRGGHGYVTMGPRLVFEAQAGERRYIPGDYIPDHSGSIDFELELAQVQEGCTLRWIKNGATLSEQPLQHSSVHLHYMDAPDWARSNWYRVDLFDRGSEMCTISNPIYAGRPPVRPHDTWRQCLERARREGMIMEQTIFT